MTLFESIILGTIQGLTEFLPISSSGHLVLFQSMMGIKQPGNEFEVLVHLGTLGSVLFVFYKDIFNLLRTLKLKSTRHFILMVILGTIPTVVIGLTLKNFIASLFENINNVGIALIFTGFFLISTFFIKRKNLKNSLKKSLLIGICQAIAIIPGISRSGITISCALLLGISPKKAAQFSFMLAIPAISGAGILTALDINSGYEISSSIAFGGIISSFFVGVISLKWLLRLLQTGKFHFFGFYCIAIGLFANFL